MFRDGVLKSIWQSEIVLEKNSLRQQSYDVVIAGAGITGLSCAVSLQRAGLQCLLLEAENSGFGTTGGTTAHLNTFFDATYPQVIKDFGLDGAKLLAQSGQEAIDIIKSNIASFGIDCDFEHKTAYLFATDQKQLEELDKIAEGTEKVGIHVETAETIPFPIPFIKAICIKNQAQFHPLKYINALKTAFMEMGGIYVDKCRVLDKEKKENELVVSTSLGQVICKNLIYATHTPPGINLIHFRNVPWRSYVVGVELKDLSYPHALGYDLADPYHYYRSQQIDGKWYLIAGGKDHKTGSGDAEDSFRQLENHVRRFFNVKDISFTWSSQYYEPADGLPYIGMIPGGPDNVFTATGYTGNGMIFGTIAGKILTDLLTEGKSKYEGIFNPRRVKPIAGFSNFVSHNASVVSTFITDRFIPENISELQELGSGEGKIINYDGKSYAAYRDPAQKFHLLENLCTHAKCSVQWNNAELSWDCPCHGSRFGVQGNVLNAPAVKGLQCVELNDNNLK